MAREIFEAVSTTKGPKYSLSFNSKLNPLLVRILMVVLALATPAGFLFYILAWLFIPEAPAPE
ncbi:MAG: PspC domain-containing protein, partial [Thermodesulfobacteriota bacterium]|nr:PspC domain-containing protein [Thermodesulfobacteriota bacterium]